MKLHRRWWWNLQRRNLRDSIQRFRRGWADTDAWNVDSYLADVLPAMLDKMATGMAYPPDRESHEAWAAELRTAAANIREGADEMWVTTDFDPAHEADEVADAEAGLAKYRAGMQWVTDNVGNLWD